MVFSDFECREGGRDLCSPLRYVSQVSQMSPGPTHLTLDLASRRGFLNCRAQFFFRHKSEAAFSVQLVHENKPPSRWPLAQQGDRSKWNVGTEKAISWGEVLWHRHLVLTDHVGAPLYFSELAFRPTPSSGQWVVSKSSECHSQPQTFKSR